MARYYVDIDGTLTYDGANSWGKPRSVALKKMRLLCKSPNHVVLWSARGQRYAEQFAERYSLKPDLCLGKPDYIVDDNARIRTEPHMQHVSPEEFERWEP